MKRGINEDQTMGPMFPRLHVNDTDKGGPRAPPRNKMSLYEQLSIPSQRFNGGTSPYNPDSAATSIPPPSSTPGTMNPFQQSSSKTDTRHSELNNPRVRQQEHKGRQEDDEFQVPIFDQQLVTSRYHQNRENVGITQFGAAFSVQNATQSQMENSPNFARSGSNNPEADIPLWGESGLNLASKATGYENTSVPFQREALRSSNDPTNADAVSERSMVDSICGVDISSEDVVGIIGQKHFWKVRRAIINQQRIFAVQVFELHRLIKVQRLMAGSPQLLFEQSAYLSKPPNATTIKKIPLEYVIKPKHQNDKNALEKLNDEMEFSAESALGKASLSSVRNGSQTTYCKPFSGNPLPVPPPPPADIGSWNYNPPPGHQWLIPVISPSEGLVYKPYPGPPGLMNSVYGGCGPMIGNDFGNYGVPLPPSEGPTGVHPLAPPAYNMTPVNASINPVKVTASTQSDVQASTASNRSDGTRNRNELPLFPTSPPVPPPAPAASKVEVAELPRVIRVVPHNARSATASVARIFQSIQEERKQCGD